MFGVFALNIKVSITFENGTIKLSVNEAKLTGLWARNFATIQLVLISKLAFEPEKLSGLRNKPQNKDFGAVLQTDLTRI